MGEAQSGQRVGEVTASQTQRVEAQCYRPYAAPPLGSLVRIGSPAVYAVALDIRHEPLDPTRPLTPRGADLETEDELYAANPQLSAILTTRFTAAIVGYRDGAAIRAGLPSLPPELSEFLILLTARQWDQQYEWAAHYPIALDAGIDQDIVDAIAEGRVPEGMTDDQAILHALFSELNGAHQVNDETYARAVAAFGERGVIDAVGIIGYYTLLAMVMNTARTPVPAIASDVPPLPAL